MKKYHTEYGPFSCNRLVENKRKWAGHGLNGNSLFVTHKYGFQDNSKTTQASLMKLNNVNLWQLVDYARHHLVLSHENVGPMVTEIVKLLRKHMHPDLNQLLFKLPWYVNRL